MTRKRSKQKTKSRYCKHNLFCMLLWQNWTARIMALELWSLEHIWCEQLNFRVGRYVLDYLPILWYFKHQKFVSTWVTYLFDHMHEKNCTIHTFKNSTHLVWLLGKIHTLSIEVLDRYEPCHEKTCLCHMRTTKAQISLRICAVWSPLLFTA